MSAWELFAAGAGVGALAIAVVFVLGVLLMLYLIAAGEERKERDQ